MYSLEIIRKMNDEATRRARQEKAKLYIAKTDKDIGVKSCKRLGKYIPDGWKVVNTYFVDNSGFGAEDEFALTFSQFLQKVKVGRGYGIDEVGQFQVYINEYERI